MVEGISQAPTGHWRRDMEREAMAVARALRSDIDCSGVRRCSAPTVRERDIR
jgi:hypothetical protein